MSGHINFPRQLHEPISIGPLRCAWRTSMDINFMRPLCWASDARLTREIRTSIRTASQAVVAAEVSPHATAGPDRKSLATYRLRITGAVSVPFCLSTQGPLTACPRADDRGIIYNKQCSIMNWIYSARALAC